MLDRYLNDVIRCPDDGHKLLHRDSSLMCEKCQRLFPILAENAVELLPSQPYSSEEKDRFYQDLLIRKFAWDSSARAWGEWCVATPGSKAYVTKERAVVGEFLFAGTKGGLLLDASGGSGNYSLHFAKNADAVIHNDLANDSINSAHAQCRQQNLGNVLIVRADYYQLPYATDAFDYAICLGHTLNKGNVARVLSEMIRCLKPGGRFAADFPNRPRWVPLFISHSDEALLNDLPIPENAGSVKLLPVGYVPTRLCPFESVYAPLNNIFRICGSPPSTFVVFGTKTGK